MPSRKNLPLFAFIAAILALIPAILAARPTEARVDLGAGKGEAVWLFRSCRSGQPGDAASWAVDLNPSVRSRSSLRIQVQNAYPGYRLVCDLYFANSGKLPISVKDIAIHNPNPDDLHLSVIVVPSEREKALQPCASRPHWGESSASHSAHCRSKVRLALTLGPEVAENTRLDFAVRVRLEEKRGGRSR